ncbi:hypothetical protein ACO0LB_06250 [Undibacterium sp. SXout7W]|uniref:hypothetical protein n=1 Tax=Undibacterium sp. SXout7W TaxID=3413049 RepID=UPI003BF2B3D6
MIDQTTIKRQYALPHVQNKGTDDVDRVRSAIAAIDSDVNALIETSDHLQINKADQTTVDNQQLQITNLSVLVFASL